MKYTKTALIVVSCLLVGVGACGSNLVDFAESKQEASSPPTDSGVKPIDSGSHDSPQQDSGLDSSSQAPPDSGSPADDDDSTNPPDDNCAYNCLCAKTSCEDDCDSTCTSDRQKEKCIYNCACSYGSCMDHCNNSCNCK